MAIKRRKDILVDIKDKGLSHFSFSQKVKKFRLFVSY